MHNISPSTSRLPWDIWLSLNPESDATAIWLERKFDMPDSGAWASESVFTIPLSTSRSSRSPGFPGLIVFECTPVGDIVDELEKYVSSFFKVSSRLAADVFFAESIVY